MADPNQCSPWSTLGIKVTWLKANDVMLPLVKNIYLIDNDTCHDKCMITGLTCMWMYRDTVDLVYTCFVS